MNISNVIYEKWVEFLKNREEELIYDDGYEDGVLDGYSEGYEEGRSEGYEEGRSEGYDDGYEDAESMHEE